MKVAIVGAGALGCLYGGILSKFGHDVWLLHRREEPVETLNRDGLRIESEYRDDFDTETQIRVSATSDANDVGVADLVVFLVKSHQTEEAARQHSACVDEGSIVLTLQNGLRNYERLQKEFGKRMVLGGVAYQGAVSVDPGHVRHTGDGRSVIGGPDSVAARRVESVFDAAGLQVERVDDPLVPIWEKQLVSLAIKPVAALTRLTNDRLVESDDLLGLMGSVIDEAVEVAHARGIGVEANGVIDEIVEVFENEGGDDESHRSSMLQDVEAGRKTEIDEINGAIVWFGESEGVDVSQNRTLAVLVRGLERSYLAGD